VAETLDETARIELPDELVDRVLVFEAPLDVEQVARPEPGGDLHVHEAGFLSEPLRLVARVDVGTGALKLFEDHLARRAERVAAQERVPHPEHPRGPRVQVVHHCPEFAAWLDHAVRLSECSRRVRGHVQHPPGVHDVESVALEGQFLGVGPS